MVQLGTSEKVPVVVSYIAAFVCGMILAYVRSWRLALALTSMIPCIAITGAVMNKFVARYKTYVHLSIAWLRALGSGRMLTTFDRSSLQSIASAGTIAEEVISTIRTAQAFGTQRILSGLYDGHVNKSRDLKAYPQPPPARSSTSSSPS